MVEKLTSKECKHCGAIDKIVKDDVGGQIVCSHCGIVHQSRLIDETSEWRNFSAETNNSSADPCRVGAPVNNQLSDYGMTTNITNVSPHGNLAKWHTRTNMSSTDKSRQRGFISIREKQEPLHLSKVVTDISMQIFKEVEERKSLKGRNLEAVVAAVIFLASRELREVKNIGDIVSVTGTKKKDVIRCYRKIQKDLKSRTEVNYSSFVPPLGNKLGLDPVIISRSEELVAKMEERELLTGKQPNTVAGVAIYIIALMEPEKIKNLTIKEISKEANISDATIKNSFKEVFPHRHEFLTMVGYDNTKINHRLDPKR